MARFLYVLLVIVLFGGLWPGSFLPIISIKLEAVPHYLRAGMAAGKAGNHRDAFVYWEIFLAAMVFPVRKDVR